MLRDLYSPILSFLIKPKYYLSLCCIIKDENRYLQEWISYHLKIGVEHFYIYDNESVVPVEDTLRELGLLQHATIIPIKGPSKQTKAYKSCLKNFGTQSRWIGFIDMDEFLVPKSTDGDLPGFLKDYESYGGLGVNWLIFGSSGFKARTDESQLSRFVLRSELDFMPNTHIKSIVQPRYVRRILNPHAFKYRFGRFCVNENFERIKDAFSPTSVQKIQLNHYYCRSQEEYEEKIKRGRSDNVNLKRKMDDFRAHDLPSNKVKDTVICELLERLNSKIVDK
jgi:hypothetical protein